ncbi:hypothetical protein FP828_03685 [bacterium]|nr:hypothetical protein [Candidatus Omnitrophota bacterium]MBA3065574.1 hypothetical protein [bacterium]
MNNELKCTDEIVNGRQALKRHDGLVVFPDANDPELDAIRKSAPKKAVIQAVAIRRAQQIAHNYAEKYAPELLPYFKITPLINNRRMRRYLTSGARLKREKLDKRENLTHNRVQ